MGFWPLVEAVLRDADIILLVLDARMPELSRNEELEKKALRLGKPLLFVFTKRDLISDDSLNKLKKTYPDSFFVSGLKNLGISELRRSLQITASRMKKSEPKIGVVGYPNLGKSAIINALARRKKSEVADMPGTTRGIQWVKAGNLRILDTPGVIPYEDKSSKLVLLGSKHPTEILNSEKIALDIIRMFLSKKKEGLEERYKITILPLTYAEDILVSIGKKRGFLKKGGEVDESKTAIYIIQDWQKGKLKI